MSVIDRDGFRSNIGIILLNKDRQVFWAKRARQPGWQFPQGGMHEGESQDQTMYRELWEEVGLRPEHVQVLACTRRWLRYRLPEKYLRLHQKPVCVGQKQKWYLLQLLVSEDHINLNASGNPEFDEWHWVDYWRPLSEVIAFKRKVYVKALKEFSSLVEAMTS